MSSLPPLYKLPPPMNGDKAYKGGVVKPFGEREVATPAPDPDWAMIDALGGRQVAGGRGGFAQGGFTGPGPKHQPAGIVHAGEFVIPKEAVAKFTIPQLDAMFGTDSTRRKTGYARGGFVPPQLLDGSTTAPASQEQPWAGIDYGFKLITNDTGVQTGVGPEQPTANFDPRMFDPVAAKRARGGTGALSELFTLPPPAARVAPMDLGEFPGGSNATSPGLPELKDIPLPAARKAGAPLGELPPGWDSPATGLPNLTDMPPPSARNTGALSELFTLPPPAARVAPMDLGEFPGGSNATSPGLPELKDIPPPSARNTGAPLGELPPGWDAKTRTLRQVTPVPTRPTIPDFMRDPHSFQSEAVRRAMAEGSDPKKAAELAALIFPESNNIVFVEDPVTGFRFAKGPKGNFASSGVNPGQAGALRTVKIGDRTLSIGPGNKYFDDKGQPVEFGSGEKQMSAIDWIISGNKPEDYVGYREKFTVATSAPGVTTQGNAAGVAPDLSKPITPEQARKLPKGTRFIGHDGIARTIK